MAEKRPEMESRAKHKSNLPELKITPFKGTPEDWIRFENMFTTQVHNKSTSVDEKFGYLLELVGPKLRERFANLKPGELGYCMGDSSWNMEKLRLLLLLMLTRLLIYLLRGALDMPKSGNSMSYLAGAMMHPKPWVQEPC